MLSELTRSAILRASCVDDSLLAHRIMHISCGVGTAFADWCGCAGRYRDQRDRPDLTNPDSLALYLDSRFEQLRVRAHCSSTVSLWLQYMQCQYQLMC